MGRRDKPTELAIDGLVVKTWPLKFEEAEDILPDVTEIVAHVMDAGAKQLVAGNLDVAELLKTENLVVLLPLLGPILKVAAAQLGQGKLKRLAPLVLATTTVVMKGENGEALTYDMCKTKDRGDVFDEHPEAYFAILFHAGRVTFGPFFSVKGLSGKPAPAKTTSR